MSPLDLLPSNPPHLSKQLERRTNEVRSRMARINYNTQFVQTAHELAEFRHATVGALDEMQDDALSQSCRNTVQFTTYDSYAPFVARFFKKPCESSAIVDLFSPGVPDFLLTSSSTTGGRRKWFPRYNCLSKIRSLDAGASSVICDPLRRRTKASIQTLLYYKWDVEDKDCSATTIYLNSVSALNQRMEFCFDPERDEEKMATFILDHAAPYAAGFIPTWRSFLLIHALFALGSKSLEAMHMSFISTFVDMMRYLDVEFEMMVDCIANGTIPDLGGIADVRHYLELNMSPDPERAAELRTLGRPSSRQGWCSLVWPNLRSVTSIASGTFASSVPLAQWFLGPNAAILSYLYSTTEAIAGWPYNPLELNQYKVDSNNIFEFLDISKSDSIGNIAQLWEVEQGRRYEMVMTTSHGLWRYRLGDVVEIAGFDPTDGVPIVHFVERRNVAIRFKNFMVSEMELRAVMSAAIPGTLVKVVDWTTTIDDRQLPATIGFFVELSESSDQVPDLALATANALDALSGSNVNIARDLSNEVFRKPTIRLVRSGTFSDFRQLKLDDGNLNNLGQVKVPVVLPKPAYVTWFSQQVVQEL